jgi:D-erythro-7,8-dihydroneopterin triphosphate epimerase
MEVKTWAGLRSMNNRNYKFFYLFYFNFISLFQLISLDMFLIRIKNLRVSTYIGFNPEELIHKQEVVINLEMKVEVPQEALEKDEPIGIYDYRSITKKVIALVEEGRFKLLEVLVQKVLHLVMSYEKVFWAKVEIDKPGALSRTESVSVVKEASR